MKTNFASRATFFNLRVLIGFAFCSIGLLRASAQIGGGGTTNYVPLWTGSSTLGDSSIYETILPNHVFITLGPTASLFIDNDHFVPLHVATKSVVFPAILGANTATGFTQSAGVSGFNDSTGGYGVFAQSSSTDPSALTFGVAGDTASPQGAGVSGSASTTTGTASGVYGTSASPLGYGVYGTNTSGAGLGVYGQSVNGIAVYGVSTSGYGVYATSSTGVGMQGTCAPTGSDTCFNGVAGLNQTTSGNANGLWGLTMSPQGNAIYLVNSGGGNLIYGTQTNGGSATFYVQGNGGGFFGGSVQINGNLNVGGTLTKGGGSFKIDDPLDPANKYLSHSFVESPDMMNVYNGNITTDAKGSAIVELPEYFEALNRDFRYQLTVIGQFAQAMVAKEISHNHFKIRTSQPSVKVSWQVTGIRKDAWANAHRIATEEDKPSEKRGTYLYPELYGASADKNKDAIAQE